jgi:hypothetical protein
MRHGDGTGAMTSTGAVMPWCAGARWLGPLAIACTFLALAAWSWRKWTDVHIDFGNELYIAWQLGEGKALYRDIAHRNGPLSHYLNALVFCAFGVSIRTLVFANLVVLGAICAMLHRVFRLGCDRFTATVACIVLLGVFGFSQYVPIANFNYVTPYQHFQTHGLALSLALLLALERCARTGSRAWAGAAGAALGLVFLTKIELFVPAAAMTALAWALMARRGLGRERRGAPLRCAPVFGAAAALPVLLCLLFLTAQMPLDLAWRGVLGNWSYLDQALAADAYYRAVLGANRPLQNAGLALAALAGMAGVAAVVAGLDRALPALGRHALPSALVGLVVFALLQLAPRAIPWLTLARALPLTTALALVLFVWRCRHAPSEGEFFQRQFVLALWSGFGLALLGKMLLSARFQHYGFVLAMPAATLLAAGAVGGLPAWLRERGGGGWLARSVGVALVATAVLFFWGRSNIYYARKDLRVGSGADAILAENPSAGRRAQIVATTLERLEALMPPDATLLVLPEGISFNYLLRKENPTRFNLFLPTEIAAFGEASMLRELATHAPDFIVLAHRKSEEFGVGRFGVDPRNGRRLLAWIRANYRRVERIGAEPFGGGGFGTVILRRGTADDEAAAGASRSGDSGQSTSM